MRGTDGVTVLSWQKHRVLVARSVELLRACRLAAAICVPMYERLSGGAGETSFVLVCLFTTVWLIVGGIENSMVVCFAACSLLDDDGRLRRVVVDC